MEETVLYGFVVVAPRQEPGRNLVIQASPDKFTRVPLDPQEVRKLVRELQLTDEELNAEVARRRAAQVLAIPGQNSPNGGVQSPN